MTVNQLTYFTVEGHWYDVEAPLTSGSTNAPQFQVVSAFVTFTPRLRPGTTVFVSNLDLGTQLAAPSGLAVAASGTGGTLAAGTYYWVATAVNANGETTRSNEVTATVGGATSSAVLSVTAETGTTGYNWYRGTVAGGENIEVGTSTLPTFTDTGQAGTSKVPPSTNTAEISANTSLAIAPVTARILNGELEVINQGDTPQVQLLANTPAIGLTSLIYDVSFTNVVYADAARTISNFAFTAPTSATTIDLTDPALTRLAYDPTNYS